MEEEGVSQSWPMKLILLRTWASELEFEDWNLKQSQLQSTSESRAPGWTWAAQQKCFPKDPNILSHSGV